MICSFRFVPVFLLLCAFFQIATGDTKDSDPTISRVIVSNNTVTASDGKLLRGAACFFDVHNLVDMRENEEAYHRYFLSIFKNRALNCVRICPWIGKWSYDIVGNEHHRKEYLYAIDRYVDWCEEAGIYAIVNLHIEYKTVVDLEKAKAAWDVLAPRYRDRAHVIFELVNEPEPESSFETMAKLYEHVRSLAPETHLICFSHVAATQYADGKLKKASKGIDFGNASVGFHCYDSVLQSTRQWDRAEELRVEGFPMICTEFTSLTNNNDMPIICDTLMHCVMRAEDRDLSWIGWGPFAQYRNSNKPAWTSQQWRFVPVPD